MRFSKKAARAALAVVLVATCVSGCSIRKLAIDGLADALESAQKVYASDDDPELVRDALPFALKTMEALIVESPEDRSLLVSASSGFAQYTYAFVEADAERAEPIDFREARRIRERAVRLYLRARDYGLRALELEHPGIGERLVLRPEAAADEIGEDELEALYWTATSWGAAISAGRGRPELVADVAAVRALMERALEIDASFMDGAIHIAMISLESLPEMMGGSPERARVHFERAIELSDGEQAAPYVALATGITISQQDRAEFERLLEAALAIDPSADPRNTLANRVTQDRARRLLERADELFL